MSSAELEHLIRQYGYFAVLLGTFFEGETVLILGGIAAQQGHLRLPLVLLFAFLEFGASVGQPLDPKCERLQKWYARVAARPSTAPSPPNTAMPDKPALVQTMCSFPKTG